MPLYAYVALTRDGKKVKGVIDALSQLAARQQLNTQELFPISIMPAQEELRYSFIRRLFMRNVSLKEKILFSKQLAILLRSGVPLLQAIELLVDQFTGRLHSILITIRDELKEGTSFANALQKYPKVFDTIYVQLVRAGEASGNLEKILERLTEFLERRATITKKIRGAMQMPLIQLVIAAIVVIGLMTFIVPKIAKQFVARGKELPGTTKLLISISNLFINHYLLLIALLIALIASYKYWKSTASGRLMLDKIKLRIPVVKYLTKTNAVIQFSYTLGMLLEGGVNLAEALDIVVKTIDNKILTKTLNEARENIVKQGKIAQYLKQTGMFPPIAIYLIQTGEQSGQLDTMLLTVARNYESDAMELTDRLTGLLNPLMLIMMGLIVGFIVLSLAPILVAS
ncbi:MAG TPA: type II secretion system F family protein [Candidatus Babeliales bacterium]|jgi:type II secretory pathway component PulF|nr:type II secretion system F family protein [Candidatus Babeliales bacterium]